MPTEKEFTMLETFPLFSSLPPEHIALLEGISREISVKKGELLFSPGDATRGFFAVADGVVRLYRVSSRGKEISLEIVDSGNTFAEASLFSDVYHCYAEALNDSRVCLINKDAFLQLTQKNFRFAASWMHFLSMKIIHLHRKIEELSLKTPKARIVSYLLLLSQIQNKTSVTLPAHKKSIATLLGMTHETFYRMARELETEGLVSFDGQRIELGDHLLLEEQAE